ncbi:MAG: hypothetical protein IRY85_19300, partial [Micromonosporaceae bacterium]|nr:hypothetical protein [Micromonosporaceae bacterium]
PCGGTLPGPPAAPAGGGAAPVPVPPVEVAPPVAAGSPDPAAAASQPTTPMPPVTAGSADPTPGPSQPTTAMPAPVTGAPYPVTGVPYPVTAPPYGLMPPPAPRRSPWVIVLGIVSAVLLVGSGVLGALYYQQRDEARRTSADQQARITALQQEVAQLKDDLADTETRLQRAEDDLADADACSDAVQKFIDLAMDLATSGTTDLPPVQAEQLIFEMVRACRVSL